METQKVSIFRVYENVLIIWTIAIVNQKGGVGKTTVAMRLLPLLRNAHLYDPELVGNGIRDNYPEVLYAFGRKNTAGKTGSRSVPAAAEREARCHCGRLKHAETGSQISLHSHRASPVLQGLSDGSCFCLLI